MKQILTEIKELRTDVTTLKGDVSLLKDGQERLETSLEKLEIGQKEIQESIIRLEEGQPKDIVALLDRINKKLDKKGFEIQVLNKRVFEVETELESLNRQ